MVKKLRVQNCRGEKNCWYTLRRGTGGCPQLRQAVTYLVISWIPLTLAISLPDSLLVYSSKVKLKLFVRLIANWLTTCRTFIFNRHDQADPNDKPCCHESQPQRINGHMRENRQQCDKHFRTARRQEKNRRGKMKLSTMRLTDLPAVSTYKSNNGHMTSTHPVTKVKYQLDHFLVSRRHC